MKSAIPLVLLACFASTVAAGEAARPDPANPAVAGLPLTYQSAFAGYRPWVEDKSLPWPKANDEMRRLGGHAGHVRSAAPASKKAPK